MVGYVVYGRGSFNQLNEILKPNRKGESPMIFFVDHYFAPDTNANAKNLINRIPLQGKDKIFYVDVAHEPKTTYVDSFAL